MATRKLHRRSGAQASESATTINHTADSWLRPLLIAAIVAATFWPVCGHDFTTWDDFENVARNAALNPPTLASLAGFWRRPFLFMYVPATYSLWGVLAAIGRLGTPDAMGVALNPYIFHAANLVLHIAAAIFAYKLLLLLVRRPWPAFAGALLFAVHPVQVEPVAWVTGMKDLLAGVFSIAAMWQYVCAVEPAAEPREQTPAQHKRVHYWIATLLFALALLSKPSAIIVPPAIILLDRWVLNRRWRAIAISAGPWLVMTVPVMVVAKLAQPSTAAVDAGLPWQRPLLAADALCFYLAKIAFPAHLVVQYHYSPQVILAGRWVYFAWMIPGAIAVLIWRFRRSAPWAIVAGGLLLAGTLPVLGLVPFNFEMWSLVADRYLYLAMLGPALAVSAVLSRTSKSVFATVVASVLLLTLAARSWAQTWYWRDTVALFEHNLAINPQSDAANRTLAAWYLIHGQFPRAIDYANAAIQIEPHRAAPYMTLGQAWLGLRRPDAALAPLRRACELEPDNADLQPAHLNLALVLFSSGKKGEAMAQAQAAVHLDQADPRARANLAFMLADAGQRDAAVREYQAALVLDPHFVPAIRGLARLAGPQLGSPRR